MKKTGQSSSAPQAKTSDLAIASLTFALLSIISLFILPRAIVDDICFLIFLISAPLALVFGIISIFKIIKSKGRLKGKTLAIAGIVISSLLAAYIIYVIVSLSSPGCTAYPILYRTSMKDPGKAIIIYVGDNNNQYPIADKWCNILFNDFYVQLVSTG